MQPAGQFTTARGEFKDVPQVRWFRLGCRRRFELVSAADLVPWFQMASTIITGVGVMVSIGLGIATIKNNKLQRVAKIRPELMFNIGGQLVSATVAELHSFPGKDPRSSRVHGHAG